MSQPIPFQLHVMDSIHDVKEGRVIQTLANFQLHVMDSMVYSAVAFNAPVTFNSMLWIPPSPKPRRQRATC